jgi:Fe-S cluster assembly ATP-binding protein
MAATPMLHISGLHASIGTTEILKGLELSVPAGQVHAIMGPNGSGKSTLAKVITGHPGYRITAGNITFQGEDLLQMAPEKRAQAGVFMSFQHPVEVPGVRLDHFMRAGYNAIRKARGEDEIDVLKFDRMLKGKVDIVEMDPALTKRFVHDGFSGGEKKKTEILQMALLEPVLSLLDEVDSGLDVDALRQVADGVNSMRSPKRSMLLVTHYQRILSYVVPDAVHVIVDGRIVMTGDKDLALEVESRGYEWVETRATA